MQTRLSRSNQSTGHKSAHHHLAIKYFMTSQFQTIACNCDTEITVPGYLQLIKTLANGILYFDLWIFKILFSNI